MKLKSCKRDLRIEIGWLNSQRAIEHRLFVSITLENSVTERNLLERFNMARV